MGPRGTDFHRKRKDLIMAIVVDYYIKTVTPISSGLIAKESRLGLSSATIRNILSELESEGYLTHPHTSAGRVPTQQGYRYYVDHLVRQIQLLGNEKERIKREYQKQVSELEVLLEKTSECLSELTNYTSIISVDGYENKFFCKGTRYVVDYPQARDFQRIQYILSALEEKERILEIVNRHLRKKIEIYIGAELQCDPINDCAIAVSSYKTNHGHSGRIAVLGPTRMDYKRVISALDYFSGLMKEVF